MANQRKRRASSSTTKKAGRSAAVELAAPRSERRNETLRQRREQRLQTRDRQRRQQLVKRASLAGVALLALASVAWIGNTLYRDWNDNRALAAVESYQVDLGHVQGEVNYAQLPPAGGQHNAVWQNCAFYGSPVANENAVHSMEHGAVWITFRPDLPVDQVEQLRDLARNTSYVLVSPYPELPAPVVASAWGKQIKLDSASDDRLDSFIRQYRQGPQTPEPGAACTGGTSATK